MNESNLITPQVCVTCGQEFWRTLSKANNIESVQKYRKRKYCSRLCGKREPMVMNWFADMSIMPKDRPFLVKIFESESEIYWDGPQSAFVTMFKSRPKKFNFTYVTAWAELTRSHQLSPA